MNDTPPNTPQPESAPQVGAGSLLDESAQQPAPVTASAPRTREPLARRLLGTPARKAVAAAMGLALVVGGGVYTYLELRPTPKPDYELDSLDLVFDFTLLEEEFNKLPVEERIELLSTLWERMQSMDTSQSVLLASFAGSITGNLREQLERNVSRLMIDAMDMYALDYQDVPEEDREEWLEDAFVRMTRLAEPFDPGLANRTDEQILERGRRNAQRDSDALQRGDVSAEDMGGFMSFAYRQGRNNGSLREQQRLAVFFRDLTRELRRPSEEQASTPGDERSGEGGGGG